MLISIPVDRKGLGDGRSLLALWRAIALLTSWWSTWSKSMWPARVHARSMAAGAGEGRSPQDSDRTASLSETCEGHRPGALAVASEVDGSRVEPALSAYRNFWVDEFEIGP